MTANGAWTTGNIPVCLRPCKNKGKKCDKCFKFSEYKNDRNDNK
jgi:hypothetical protein